MKFLIKDNFALAAEGRWDIDYHLPAEGILQFPEERVVTVSTLADVSNQARDPSQKPDKAFMYVDIASVDISTGTITNPQELTGEEAPSRARMVIRAFDVIVSTVRATRGATAVVPSWLDNQICSTGFCVLRCKTGINPYYLHFVLRLDSTLEQFRKFSTGSSYPAILDTDVLKTRVPLATPVEQDAIAKTVMAAYAKREELLQIAKQEFDSARNTAVNMLESIVGTEVEFDDAANHVEGVTIAEIEAAREGIMLRSLLDGTLDEHEVGVAEEPVEEIE